MAKKDSEVQKVEATRMDDVNPKLAFVAAWLKDAKLRAVLTKTGLMRSNLRPSEQAKARELKQQYGI